VRQGRPSQKRCTTAVGRMYHVCFALWARKLAKPLATPPLYHQSQGRPFTTSVLFVPALQIGMTTITLLTAVEAATLETARIRRHATLDSAMCGSNKK